MPGRRLRLPEPALRPSPALQMSSSPRLPPPPDADSPCLTVAASCPTSPARCHRLAAATQATWVKVRPRLNSPYLYGSLRVIRIYRCAVVINLSVHVCCRFE